MFLYIIYVDIPNNIIFITLYYELNIVILKSLIYKTSLGIHF